MANKIYITGCARSGTTLLARMFHAFSNVTVFNEEVNIYDFCKYKKGKNSDILIAKRTEHTIFSNTLAHLELCKQAQLLEDKKIIVINCIRDGRFVVDAWLKAWTVYDPQAWMNAISQSHLSIVRSVITINVKYEEILLFPDRVQQQIMDAVNEKLPIDVRLIKKHAFSEYPKFVPKESFNSKNKKYRLRPLETPPITIPDTYLMTPNDIQYFEKLLQLTGYIGTQTPTL